MLMYPQLRRSLRPLLQLPHAMRIISSLEIVSIHGVSNSPFHFARLAVAKAWGADLEPGVTIYHGAEIRAARNLHIGERTSIGNGSILDARGGLTIGHDVNISTGVHIWTAQHDWRSEEFGFSQGEVRIGDRVWISDRACVLPGVSIGDGAVVAAGAVVTSDVAADSLVAGVPARRIAVRENPTKYHLPDSKSKLFWW